MTLILIAESVKNITKSVNYMGNRGIIFFDLYQPAINAIHSLLADVKQQIEALDSSVTGFNVGINAVLTAES